MLMTPSSAYPPYVAEPGPRSDFYPADLFERKMIAELQRAVNRFVELLAINQQQDFPFGEPNSREFQSPLYSADLKPV